MKDSINRRLEKIESFLKPKPLWKVTAEYEDGTMRIMSAQDYRKEKARYHERIRMVDCIITSDNLVELQARLDTVAEEANYMFDNGIEGELII